MSSIGRTLNHWRTGVRFYIALAIIAVTLNAWWWAHANYAGTALFAARLEEFFAWLSLGMITTAVFIGPTYKFFPQLPGRRIMSDARRLIGVGGAWFATLHVTISYSALFHWANPLSLPTKYQQAFAIGSVALVILLAMAFTSFDAAFNKMGIWWFRLHRFVYLALLAIVAHAFLIGVHATKTSVMLVLLFAALFLLAFHIIGQRDKKPSSWRLLTLSSVAVLLILIFNYGFSHQQSRATGATKGSYTQ